MTRFLIAVALVGLATKAAADCNANRDYQQLKDSAASQSGRISLAFDACRASRGFDNAHKLQQLALQYHVLSDAKKAGMEMEACLAEKSKITDALSARNSTGALRYVLNNCDGEYKDEVTMEDVRKDQERRKGGAQK